MAGDEVITAIRRLPEKQCDTDLLPTWLFKHCAVEQAPFLCRLFNCSLQLKVQCHVSVQCGVHYSEAQKLRYGSSFETRSYRLISNLPVVSKLLECLVSSHMLSYFKSTDLMPPLQSAYRAGHSTETAVTKVLADIFCWR